ncbi:hypothetical protein BGZ65_006091, partial [Modicella reniformis]
ETSQAEQPFELSQLHPAISSSTYMTKQHFVQSSDTLPQALMVVPLEGHSYFLRLHKAVRIIALCQAPSITDRREDSFHMTDHSGYTIKNPGDFEHCHRKSIMRLAKTARRTVRVTETAAGFAGNVSSRPGDVAVSTLSSLHEEADNRARLNRVGIYPYNFYSIQFVVGH